MDPKTTALQFMASFRELQGCFPEATTVQLIEYAQLAETLDKTEALLGSRGVPEPKKASPAAKIPKTAMGEVTVKLVCATIQEHFGKKPFFFASQIAEKLKAHPTRVGGVLANLHKSGLILSVGKRRGVNQWKVKGS